MRGEVKDKLWSQLESEILLQRHKTVVRACRRSSTLNNNHDKCPKPSPETNGGSVDHFGDIRVVVIKREPEQGLGISITVSVLGFCLCLGWFEDCFVFIGWTGTRSSNSYFRIRTERSCRPF